jgi:molecular chaperone GrpE
MPEHDPARRGRRQHAPSGVGGTTRVTVETGTPDASAPDVAAAAAAIAETLATLQKERDEYLDALQRERAAFQNYKRRVAEEQDQMAAMGTAVVIGRVLALADDFDRAIANRPPGLETDPWADGIVAIDRKLRQLLENEGVTAIDAQPGTPFDPRVHEAVTSVPGTGLPEGAVVDQLRRGYRLRDRVIRPAMVAVASAPADPATPATTTH